MAESNTEWRYHYAEADSAAGIDFEKYGRNGFELCGLASHAGKAGQKQEKSKRADEQKKRDVAAKQAPAAARKK